MLSINIQNETSKLKAVVLGIANSNGPTPALHEAYDPKSLEHIISGTYPIEQDMIPEMEAFNKVFQKYNVQVFRPKIIENYNQIFARDIGFVIDNIFIKSNILPDRERELDAIQYIIDQINPMKVLRPPAEVHIEGGDVMLWGNHARAKAHLIDMTRHRVLEAAHPSPLSVRKFQGCRHFSLANAFLAAHGEEPVRWGL